jgi:hypothetical protein
MPPFPHRVPSTGKELIDKMDAEGMNVLLKMGGNPFTIIDYKN